MDATGAVTSRFVYGTLSHSPDVMLRAGVTYRYVHDALGSVRLVVNVSTGQVVQRIDYDSWGVVTSDSSPGFQPFAFAGGLFDVDTRLTRFGARDYDAATGRWTSKDPIRLAGGRNNLYSFCDASPTTAVDPTGLRPLTMSEWGQVDAAIGEIAQVPGHGWIADGLREALAAGEIEGPSALGAAVATLFEKTASTSPFGAITLYAIGDSNFQGTLVHEFSHRLDVKCGKGLASDPDNPKDKRNSPAYMAEEFYDTARAVENARRARAKEPLLGGGRQPNWVPPGSWRGPSNTLDYLR